MRCTMYRYRKEYDYYHPATDKQLAFLERHDLLPNDHEPDFYEAQRVIGQHVDRMREQEPTPTQEWILQQKGLWRDDISRAEAWELIGPCKTEDKHKNHGNGPYERD